MKTHADTSRTIYLAATLAIALLAAASIPLIPAISSAAADDDTDTSASNPVTFPLTSDQRSAVANAIKEDPGTLPRVIAEEHNVSEAAVVEALPDDMSLRIEPENFEAVWADLATWEKPLLIVIASGSVFEVPGPLGTGDFGRGYYNIDAEANAWGGHLKPDNLGAIYLIQKPFRGSDTWQAAFYDKEGARVFSLYVGREGDDPHGPTLEAFEKLWDKWQS
ncbi:MAG: heme utilization cystosolic carrier protein HutX [Verrucomicrobiota bacterium]